ncbi:MAG: hypothetical protein PHP44_11395 [Kiritimatiellae bacterium]|nr:hypothetical protein [Kiritimatiellia bacterium]
MIDLQKITQHLNSNELSTAEFDLLLSEYLSSDTPPLENPLLVYVFVYASRLRRQDMLSRPFSWVRELVPPPALYRRNNNDWDLVYYLSDDCMVFIHIMNDQFDEFATQCGCTDVQAVKDSYKPWDSPILWH